jgi:phage/plasmid-associated DNA primase
VDGDLDCIEAVSAARAYFPATTMMWGRDGKPRSHLFYQLPTGGSLPRGWLSYSDPTPGPGRKGKLLELRQNGQTVAPGSLHEDTGQLVRWEQDGDGMPSPATADALVDGGRFTASVSLVSRYWPEGDRHNMSVAVSGFLWHGGMLEADALKFMTEVCRAAGDTDELENRLGSVRDTYRNGAAGQPITGGPTLVLEEYLSEPQVRVLRKWLRLKAQKHVGILGPDFLPLSGDGDGDRFAAMWTGQALYCAVEDQWYIWSGQRWEADRVGEIRERAKQTVIEFRRKLGEAQSQCGQNGIAQYKDCALYSAAMGSAANISAMLRSAGSKRELRTAPEEFDTHPEMLNVLDCTVVFDLATGAVSSHLHDPADKLTKLAPVHYLPHATHPLFMQYLRRFYPERERRLFLQEMAGYTLHGLPKRHGLQLIGPHDAGKSVTLSIFGNMLGDSEYSGTLKYTSLMKNPHGAGGDPARNDLWRVRRARLVTVSEVAPDAAFDVALLKAFLGADVVPVRDLHGKAETVQWGMTLWMSGNKDYGPASDEDAAYQRLEVLDCTHVLAEGLRVASEEWDTTHDQDVLDAAFAWAVKGFKSLYGRKHGVLIAPPTSQKRKADLRKSLDEWTGTIDTLFEFTGDKEDGVLKSEAWEWARAEQGLKKNSYKVQMQFESSLQARGAVLRHTSARFNNKEYWEGVKWTAYMVANYRVTVGGRQAVSRE